MVGPAGKPPRRDLTPQERQKCLDALRRDRRVRRNAQRESQRQPKPAAKETSREMAAAKESAAAAKNAAAMAKDTMTAANEPVEAKDTADMQNVSSKKAEPSKMKAPGKKKAFSKVQAKRTTAIMERRPTLERSPVRAGVEVEHLMEDIVTAVESGAEVVPPSELHFPLAAAAVSVSRSKVGGKRNRCDEDTRKRRRRLLQNESEDDEESPRHCDGEDIDTEPTVTPACVVTGDPNLMSAGAEECTGLNSDEDPNLCEEREDEDDDEDIWDGDWDIGVLTDEDSEEEPEELPDSIWSSITQDSSAITAMRHSEWEYDTNKFGPNPTYKDLYDGQHGPSDSVLSVAEDPLALLFYFMPPKLWRQIAVESNRYHAQSIPLRARTIRSQQRRGGSEIENVADIRSRLSKVPEIQPWEVLRVIALLIARMLAPIRKGIAAHWSTKRVGSLPANRFGLFMSKNRFFHIMGYLHFSNNKSPQAKLDRAWKIRPVVDVLQRTFLRGYRVPPIISFDEATLPSRSRYNPMRQFNKDKPHRWGTKVFVAACAKTAYCMRIEVYCGAKEHLRTPVPRDNNSGEAAVLRNMAALCPASPTSPWRLVVTDRFYTSVKLALELLHRRMYITGTIQTDRSGYAKGVVTTKKTRTVNKKKEMVPPQGTVKLAQNRQFPQLTAAMWMDRNPVHMLSTGGSREPVTVQRRIHGEMQSVPAPGLVKDYHQWMGGVDVHDQLRMQRYSVQLAYKTRKYYKTLFLGLLDMALVNAFIVHRLFRKNHNLSPPKHFRFWEELMEQLLAVDSVESFEEIEQATRATERTVPSPSRSDSTPQRAGGSGETARAGEHCLEENPDTVDCEVGVKRRHRSCKVCAIFKAKPRKFTKYFCPECSTGNRRMYLCNIARPGNVKTCFQIWHDDWSNGNDIPRLLQQEHKIRSRPPAERPGKKRSHREQTQERGGGGSDSHEKAGANESGSDSADSDGRTADL